MLALSRSLVAVMDKLSGASPHRGSQALVLGGLRPGAGPPARPRDKATVALRRAEVISPDHLHCDPLARAEFGELLVRVRQDAVGRELPGWPTGPGCRRSLRPRTAGRGYNDGCLRMQSCDVNLGGNGARPVIRLARDHR